MDYAEAHDLLIQWRESLGEAELLIRSREPANQRREIEILLEESDAVIERIVLQFAETLQFSEVHPKYRTLLGLRIGSGLEALLVLESAQMQGFFQNLPHPPGLLLRWLLVEHWHQQGKQWAVGRVPILTPD